MRIKGWALGLSVSLIALLSGCVGPESAYLSAEEEQGSAGGGGGGSSASGAEPSEAGVTPEECESAFSDADPRYHNRIAGEEHVRRTFEVERGGLFSELLFKGPQHRVTVKAIFVLEADSGERVRIQLIDPMGNVVAQEDFSGQKQLEEEEWFLRNDAMSGTWTLTIDLKGAGAYTFGVYVQ